MRALLVVNPNARRGRDLHAVLHRELEAHGIDVVRELGESSGDGAPRVDAIIAAGGDGTLVHVIRRAMAYGVPVGLVPLGTFNELARTLGIPLDVAGACATIAAGHERAIDVATVNGVYYLNEASIGISSRIARLQLPENKQRFGFLAIVATALRAFMYSRPIRVEIVHDGGADRFHTVQLTVANSHRFGGFFYVADAAIDDGWLDLYSVEIDGVSEAFSVARAILSGKRQSVPGLRTFRSVAFDVITRRRHRITADGEPAGRTPARFEIVPKALRVFTPE
ncbi:MAG TPA: YegS/Rv2252/BmrU family lipid kinase [Candidatus Acidoferrales bacterium]|nr:YegS/Rv2252/BmrU family lipid kinase [Candidatus Acidoferrales bacterium]